MVQSLKYHAYNHRVHSAVGSTTADSLTKRQPSENVTVLYTFLLQSTLCIKITIINYTNML